MVKKTKEKGSTPHTSLTIRAKATGSPGASHTQRNETGITQEARLASQNERGRLPSTHIHVPEERKRKSAYGPQQGASGAAEGSTSSTRAVASETARRPSDTESIELLSDPDHPHARDIHKNMQVFQKPFDEKDNK